MFKRQFVTVICMALLAGLFGVSGPARAQEKKLTDITFSLDFIVLGRHAPFYVAIDKGFYKDEGLNVNIVSARAPPRAFKMSSRASRISASPISPAWWSLEPKARRSKPWQ